MYLRRNRQRKKQPLHNCRLFRWESEAKHSEEFHAYGPYAADQNEALLNKAIARPEKWFCVVIAYFLDGLDYYEEQLVASPIGPLVFQNNLDILTDIVQQLVQQAMDSGDPAHYQDTCVAFYPYTPYLEKQFDNDEWVKIQASIRADLVLQHAPRFVA